MGIKTYKGVDVSSYQGKIDWPKVKNAGVEFAILKVIRKDLAPDNQFENNWGYLSREYIITLMRQMLIRP